MRVLVTSSRFPVSIGVIRHLGRAGHEVYAADTFRAAPGGHSRYVARRIVTASPRFATTRFLDDVERAVREHAIDRIIPCFEEAFYLARARESRPLGAPVVCAGFDALAWLHDKRRFAELASALGLCVPTTVSVESPRDLRDAVRWFPEYIARPAYSRGGVGVVTNAGPLAGRVPLESCAPTRERPWIVQEFVRGREVCTSSVARRGRVVLHGAYEHPKTIDHAGGIVFESVDGEATLEPTRRVVEALGYDGHLGFDFVATDDGRLVLLECNPRPTAGLLLASSAQYDAALFGPEPADGPAMVPPGERAQIGSALVRDMLRDWRQIPSDARALVSGAPDVYAARGDRRPALWSVVSLAHVGAYRRRMKLKRERGRSDLVPAQFFDVEWDGGSIDTEAHQHRPLLPWRRAAGGAR